MSDQRGEQHEDIIDHSGVGDLADIELGEVPPEKPPLPQTKGPDPEEWGDPEERRQADIERGKFSEADLVNEALQEKIDAGEDPIVEIEGRDRPVKGPDPSRWSVPNDEVTDEDE
jgi:hypothetical protein